MRPDDNVIICTGVPCWLHIDELVKEAGKKSLDYIAGIIVQGKGARVRAVLSGDIHHYSRYASGEVSSSSRRAAAAHPCTRPTP